MSQQLAKSIDAGAASNKPSSVAVGELDLRKEKWTGTQNPSTSNTVAIAGFFFPIAVCKIAKTWLGPNAPLESEILARFGAYPAQETLKSLANEVQAELGFHRDRPQQLLRQTFPLLAELNDNKALIILSAEHDHFNVLGEKGRQKISAEQLVPNLTGNWLRVHQTIASDQNTNGGSDQAKSVPQETALWPALKRLMAMATQNYRAFFVRLLTAAFLSNLLLVVLPLFITIVYDRVVPHGAFETLTALTLGVVLALMIDVGLRAARVNMQEAIGVKLGLNLQSALYRKLVSVPLATGQQFAKGFTSTINEMDHASLLVPTLVTGLLADLPFVILMLALVYALTGIVVLVPICGILIIGAAVAWGSFNTQKNARATHDARIEVQDQAIETCATLATAKATRTEHLLLDKWERRTDNSAYLNHKTRQASAFSTQLMLNITQLTIVMTIVVGAIEVNAGMMTLGNLAAATLLVGRIISPISQLIMQLGQIGNLKSGITKAMALLELQEETGGDSAHSSARIEGNIALRHVQFCYPGAADPSLKNISLDIRAGERIGVIGRNGGGKSTLLKLIPRLYAPTQGQLMFDGYDARQISPFLLRQSIGYMSQDTVLVNDSVRANIVNGVDNIAHDWMAKVSNISGVSDIVQRHPQGFNLTVGPRGEHLSGGERQAVGLARTLAANPKILLLDEPTSAMDNTTEAALIQKLPEILQDRTLILATHRMQLLRLVDRIIWIENGTIMADGPRDQVLQKLQSKAS
ncbi:peptidase domain-containing ABC transporter [Maritalea sp. S77]|uniref:peptidase domain-containing ABC transporter n=1 Tax=Maritalea sp. S77 TaxID=3415125 RepID=UPI003C7EC711